MPAITIDRYDLILLDAVQRDGLATHATLGGTCLLYTSDAADE